MAVNAGTNPGAAERQAISYLEEHRIQALIENATMALVGEQPEDPKKFLAQFLKDIKKARDAADAEQCPGTFTEENIVALYDVLDPTGTGHINGDQYHSAMSTFGITNYNRDPVGLSKGKIHRQVFITEVKAGLVGASATYAAYHG